MDTFDRFRNLLDIEILEWNDKDVIPENCLNSEGKLDGEKVMDYRKQYLTPKKHKWLRNQVVTKFLPKNATEEDMKNAMKLVGIHRFRQEHMATACVNLLRESGRSWVTLLDSDEYIQIGSTDHFDGLVVPDVYEEGAIMKWINRVYSNQMPCFKMPWLRYGASKETSEKKLMQTVPAGFDPKQFRTLRWRFHNDTENNGKHCLNLQRAERKYFPLQKITNVHILAEPVCGRSFKKVKSHPIVIGHYTGTTVVLQYLRDFHAYCQFSNIFSRNVGAVFSTRGCPPLDNKTGMQYHVMIPLTFSVIRNS